jgi:hypothetical protein
MAAVKMDRRATPRIPGGPAGAGRTSEADLTSSVPNWDRLFDAAGLDRGAFKTAVPSLTPPVYADLRQAWSGVFPDRPDIPIRIEAAAYRGQPLSFQIVAPGPGGRHRSTSRHVEQAG